MSHGVTSLTTITSKGNTGLALIIERNSIASYCTLSFPLSRYVTTCKPTHTHYSDKKNYVKGTNSEVDYISREDYQTISTKKYPAFCYNCDEIYDLFLRYEQIKVSNHDYDSVDR